MLWHGLGRVENSNLPLKSFSQDPYGYSAPALIMVLVECRLGYILRVLVGAREKTRVIPMVAKSFCVRVRRLDLKLQNLEYCPRSVTV